MCFGWVSWDEEDDEALYMFPIPCTVLLWGLWDPSVGPQCVTAVCDPQFVTAVCDPQCVTAVCDCSM